MDLPYRLITISGITCSGATTVTRLLSKEIGWEHTHPVGVMMRNFLAEHKLPLSAINEMSDEQEREMDNYLASIVKNEHHKIINGRLSGYWARDMADIYRIFITASKEKRIERFAARENFLLEKAKQELEIREQSELTKYQRLYGINAQDSKYYHLVVDTTDCMPQEALQNILDNLLP